MGTPASQPLYSASFYLQDFFLQGDRGLGPYIDRAVLLQSMMIVPHSKGSSGDTDVTWYETPTSFPAMTLSATASAAATTLNVVANYARRGDVLYITHGTTSEYVLVTAVASKALTVTRSYNGSTGAICSATASSITIAGNVNADGASLTSGISMLQNKLTNYNQISHESYELSGSSAAGILNSGDDPLAHEKMLALVRLNGRINKAIYHNASATQMTSSTPGMAKGIRGFCTTNDYAITSSSIGGTSTSTSMSWAKLSAFLWTLKQAGGSDQLVMVAGATAFNGVKLALDGNMTKYATVGLMVTGGGAVLQFVSLHGQYVRMAYDQNLPAGTLIVHDVGQPGQAGIYFSPVIGRELVDMPLNARKDVIGGDLLTEWSLIVINEATCGYVTGVTTGG